ncbi:MAG: UDP-3-O-(3-hydroxymyristoyl)glucosamine N-acyltransferase [Dongiaceae bacterium]
MTDDRRIAAGELAKMLGARLEGTAELVVCAPCHPGDAKGADDLIILFDRDLAAAAATTPARVAVVAEGLALPAGHPLEAILWVARPRYALALLLPLFEEPPAFRAGIHPTAIMDGSVALGAGVSIGPYATFGPGASIGDGSVIMGNVTIGARVAIGRNCLIHPGVRIGDRCRIGDRAVLHHNASIGADGFSFATPERSRVEDAQSGQRTGALTRGLKKIPSLGAVTIGDDVEIGANTAVDRGTVGDTRIGRGTKIDDLVMVGHNCVIGEDCLIAGHVGISGSCRLGNRVVLGGQVGIADHVTIGDDVAIMAKSGVPHDIPAGSAYAGSPAVPQKEFHRQLLYAGRLKRMFEEMKRLGEKTAALESRLEK